MELSDDANGCEESHSAQRQSLLGSFLAAETRGTPCLSARDRAVVQLIAEGHTNGQVASILEVGIKTVENQRRAIMQKLNLSSGAAIVLYAIRNGLIEP
jgi:DNA-binding NarL/FixJ family response regulator